MTDPHGDITTSADTHSLSRRDLIKGTGAGVTLGAGNVLDRGVRLFPGVALPDGAMAF